MRSKLAVLMLCLASSTRAQVPPEVVEIIRQLNSIHRATWKPGPKTVDPASRFVSDRFDAAHQAEMDQAKRLCLWVGGLDLLATGMLVSLAWSAGLDADAVRAAGEQLSEVKAALGKIWDDNHCGGGPGQAAQHEWESVQVSDWSQVLGPNPGSTVHRAGDAPFRVPPMTARDGRDFAAGALLPMLRQLELSLADGGQRLSPPGRACVWATAGGTAVDRIQRAGASTAEIDGAGRVFAEQAAHHCVGAGKAEQEAAWKWLASHPRATQPLVVPRRPAASPWPAPSRDEPLVWLLFGLAVYAPELVPFLELMGVSGQ